MAAALASLLPSSTAASSAEAMEGAEALAAERAAPTVAAARAVVEAIRVEGEVRGRAGMAEPTEAVAMGNGIRMPKPVRPLECWPRDRCPTDPIATKSIPWSRWSWRCCACRSGC